MATPRVVERNVHEEVHSIRSVMRSDPRRPNLVLIMTDQQRFDQLGYASGGHFETPNLDRLAARGVIFDTAYSGSTVCVPARSSLLTGLLDHRVPKAPRSIALQEGFWTVARALKGAGYVTALVGKMHFTPIHASHGFERMHMCEHLVVEAGYGPDDMDDYHRWLVWQGRGDFRATHHFGPGLEEPQSEFDRWYSAVPFGYDRYFHPTEWVKRESVEFLKGASRETPFLLVVSFPNPHSPYDPPEPYASMYDASQAFLPPNDAEGNHLLPRAFRDAIEKEGARAPEPVLRRILTFIRALVRHIDDAVGAILEHVDLENSVVFFTSDHGDYSGHRGLVAKSPWIAFDDLARVPFFCAGRGIAGGRRIGAPVQSSDFALTALELAGVERPPAITDTKSLFGMLAGESPDENRSVYCCTSLGWPMVRKGRFKYVLHEASGDELLIDLAADPGETRNLASDDRHADELALLRQTLREKLAEGIPDFARAASQAPPGEAVARIEDIRSSAERIAEAFTLLTTESLVPGSAVRLASAALSAVAGRPVELGTHEASAAELRKRAEQLIRGDYTAQWSAIDAMVRAVADPHTVAITIDAQRQLFAALAGHACSAPGFFAHRGDDSALIVREVLPDGPAAAAGLAPGDVIESIDGRSPHELSSLAELWPRPVGSELVLRLSSAACGRDLSLTLGPWIPPLGSFRVLPRGAIGVIRVHFFAGSQTPGRDLGSLTRAALAAFDQRGVDGVVLDLRGSFGATDTDRLVSAFSSHEPLAIFRARDGSETVLSRTGDAWPKRHRLAILVDEQTTGGGAFAAFALADLEHATIVGQPTSSVLTLPKLYDLGAGRTLFVPFFEMIGAASQESLPGHRIVPDRVVPNASAADLAAGRDLQLQAAIDALASPA